MKARIKKFLPLFAGLLFACTVSGQKKILSGIVKDAHSDERIPFASVQFLNSTVGKLSDSSGSFSFYLNQWPSDTLLITYVGYQPYKLFIPADLDSIKIEITMERGTYNEGARVKAKVNHKMTNSGMIIFLMKCIIKWKWILRT
jgi:hypothetical protein